MATHALSKNIESILISIIYSSGSFLEFKFQINNRIDGMCLKLESFYGLYTCMTSSTSVQWGNIMLILHVNEFAFRNFKEICPFREATKICLGICSSRYEVLHMESQDCYSNI